MSPPAPPICPRCGYDLSGACRTWEDSCPLDGICTECGLELAWRDVLSPARTVPRWFFEHVESARPGPLLRTLLRALLPWRFWREIRLNFDMRAGRLWIVVMLCLLITQLCLGADLLSMGAGFTAGMGPPVPFLPPASSKWLVTLITLTVPYVHVAVMNEYTLIGAPWFVMGLLMFGVMPLAFLSLPTTFQRCRVRRAHLARIGAYSLIGLPFATLAMVCVRMTISRRAGWWGWAYQYQDIVILCSGAFPLIVTLWLGVFWWFACRRYLKLPQPHAVVGAMLLVAFLFGAACVGVLHPNFPHNPVTWWFFW